MGLVMSFVNVIGRSFGVFSPLIAEMDPPIPMVSVVAVSMIAGVGSCFLVRPDVKGATESAIDYARRSEDEEEE